MSLINIQITVKTKITHAPITSHRILFEENILRINKTK